VSADELKRGALNEVGGRRMTSAIAARLHQALGFAVRTGRVQSGPEGIYRSGDAE